MKKEKKKFVVLLIILIIVIVVLFGDIYLYNLVTDDYTICLPDNVELNLFNAEFIDYEGSNKSATEIEELVALINSSNIAEKESARGLYVTLTDGTGEDYVHTNITERVYKGDYEFVAEDDEEYIVTLYYQDGAVIQVEITTKETYGQTLTAFNAKFIDYGGSNKSATEIEELVALINSSNIAEKESARGLYVTLTDGTGVHTGITERAYKDDYEFATEEYEEYTVTLYYSDGAVIQVEITK